MVSAKTSINTLSSSVSNFEGSGKDLDFSYSASHLDPYKIIMVASPPSSTKILGPVPSGHIKEFKVHNQYSLIFSPFQAKTLAVSALTIAAAASS